MDIEIGKVWRQYVESSGGPTEWTGSDPTKGVMTTPVTPAPSDAGTAIKN